MTRTISRGHAADSIRHRGQCTRGTQQLKFPIFDQQHGCMFLGNVICIALSHAANHSSRYYITVCKSTPPASFKHRVARPLVLLGLCVIHGRVPLLVPRFLPACVRDAKTRISYFFFQVQPIVHRKARSCFCSLPTAVSFLFALRRWCDVDECGWTHILLFTRFMCYPHRGFSSLPPPLPEPPGALHYMYHRQTTERGTRWAVYFARWTSPPP